MHVSVLHFCLLQLATMCQQYHERLNYTLFHWLRRRNDWKELEDGRYFIEIELKLNQLLHDIYSTNSLRRISLNFIREDDELGGRITIRS